MMKLGYRRSIRRFFTLIAFALAVTVLVAYGPHQPAPALAQPTPKSDPVAKHYRGKRLTIVVNFSPGGSTGTWLSLVARHIGRHIPGNPRVLLKYRPGAGGMVGSRYMLEVVRPDGYTIAGLGGGVARAQALGEAPPGVDIRKLIIFGGVNDVTITFARRKIFPDGIKSLAKHEPKHRPFFASTSDKDDSAVREYVWMKLLGYKPLKDFKVLTGFPGGAAERYLAIQRGEIDFSETRTSGFMTSVMPLVEEGIVIPMFQSGTINAQGKVVRHPAFPDAPTFIEVYEKYVGRIVPSADWEFLAWIRSSQSPNAPLIAPTGTPRYLVDALMKALSDMQKDPAYQRDQEKMYGTRKSIHLLGDAARKAVSSVIEGSGKAQLYFQEHVKNF